MPDSERISISTGGDGVARIVFDHAPTMNAITLTMVEQIRDALPDISRHARCLVVSGGGQHFCSGADLSKGTSTGSQKSDAGYRLETHFNPMMSDLRNLSIPWVSVVRGAAAGIGCAIALSADLIVASRNAYFLQAFRRIGLIPDGGSAFVLARAAGRVRAMEMMLLGEKVPAQTALDWGLINRCVEDDALEAEAEAIVARIASGPTRALSLARHSAWAAVERDYEGSLAVERKYQGEAGMTDDYLEGVAAFREKRPARFTGR
ncbi:MAG: enoyl-CoA hydratase-related protein [Mesorhizobium sp.]